MTIEVGDRARLRAGERAPGVREPHRRGPGGHVPLPRCPPPAAVGDFAVWDGLVRIPGVILEKQRARAIYRELTTQRIDPGLLQQGEEEDRDARRAAAVRPSGGAASPRRRVARSRPTPPSAWSCSSSRRCRIESGAASSGWRCARPTASRRWPAASASACGSRTREAVPGARRCRSRRGERARASRARRPARPGPGRALPASRCRSAAARQRVPQPDGRLPDGLALAPWERPVGDPAREGRLLPARGAAAGGAPSSQRSAAAGAAGRRARASSSTPRSAIAGRGWRPPTPSSCACSRRSRPRTASRSSPSTARRRSGARSARRLPRPREALWRAACPPARAGHRRGAALAAARRAVGDGGPPPAAHRRPGPGHVRGTRRRARVAALFTAVRGEETPEAYASASAQVLSAGATRDRGRPLLHAAWSPRSSARAAPRPGRAALRGLGRRPEPARRLPGARAAAVGREPLRLDRSLRRAAGPAALGGRLAAAARWRASLEAALPERRSTRATCRGAGPARAWTTCCGGSRPRASGGSGSTRSSRSRKRYKFVTPYTAFLAAPRSLLRPRRIQPGRPGAARGVRRGHRRGDRAAPLRRAAPAGAAAGTRRSGKAASWCPTACPTGGTSVRILLRDAAGRTSARRSTSSSTAGRR